METAVAQVRDIQPNRQNPILELYFVRELAKRCGWKHREPLELVLPDGVVWMATVGITPNNPPYLHTPIDRGHKTGRVPDLLLELELAPGARIEFSVEGGNRLHLLRIVDAGRWPEGRSPAERRSGQAGRGIVRQRRTRGKTRPTLRTPVIFPTDDLQAVQLYSKKYWQKVSATENRIEPEIEREMPRYRTAGYLDKAMFRKLARWKTPRNDNLYQQNSEDRVRAATSLAFSSRSEIDAIDALEELDGVKQRTATAILHWLRPDEFPILDIRAVRALGETFPDWDNRANYLRYANRVRALAKTLGVDLRTLDRALWAWDKMQNGPLEIRRQEA